MESVNHYHLFPIRWENSRLLKIKKNECSLSNLCSSSRNRFPTTYMELQLEALMRMMNNLLNPRRITTMNTWFHITAEVLPLNTSNENKVFLHTCCEESDFTGCKSSANSVWCCDEWIFSMQIAKFPFFWYLPSHTQYWILILEAELD